MSRAVDWSEEPKLPEGIKWTRKMLAVNKKDVRAAAEAAILRAKKDGDYSGTDAGKSGRMRAYLLSQRQKVIKFATSKIWMKFMEKSQEMEIRDVSGQLVGDKKKIVPCLGLGAAEESDEKMFSLLYHTLPDPPKEDNWLPQMEQEYMDSEGIAYSESEDKVGTKSSICMLINQKKNEIRKTLREAYFRVTGRCIKKRQPQKMREGDGKKIRNKPVSTYDPAVHVQSKDGSMCVGETVSGVLKVKNGYVKVPVVSRNGGFWQGARLYLLTHTSAGDMVLPCHHTSRPNTGDTGYSRRWTWQINLDKYFFWKIRRQSRV